MVIVESALSHRAFGDQVEPATSTSTSTASRSASARGAAIVLFAYFFLKLQGFLDGGRWDLLATRFGAWYLFEIFGFILVPGAALRAAPRAHAAPALVRVIAAWTVLGVVVNRLNVSLIAMNWSRPEAYVPSWMEIVVVADHHHDRRADVPLDRQPHAGAARAPGLRRVSLKGRNANVYARSLHGEGHRIPGRPELPRAVRPVLALREHGRRARCRRASPRGPGSSPTGSACRRSCSSIPATRGRKADATGVLTRRRRRLRPAARRAAGRDRAAAARHAGAPRGEGLDAEGRLESASTCSRR